MYNLMENVLEFNQIIGKRETPLLWAETLLYLQILLKQILFQNLCFWFGMWKNEGANGNKQTKNTNPIQNLTLIPLKRANKEI